jgi:hypothetical protein
MNNNQITGNTGEWSEYYVFLKILADGAVQGADENLEIMKEVVYPVLKVIRSEAQNGSKSYKINKDDITVYTDDGNPAGSVSRVTIRKSAYDLFKAVKEHGKGTFSFSPVSDLMKDLNSPQLKAGSGEKSDITLVIHDMNVGASQTVGFSIKSKIGGSPTLLNASRQTKLRYSVSGMNIHEALTANAIDSKGKVGDRIRAVYESGGKLNFERPFSDTFRKNLRRIDTSMDRILGEVLKASYVENKKRLSDAVESQFFRDEIADLELDSKDIEYKLKNLLWASALGMNPGKEWNGQDTVYGGYLIVREDGEVVCYHVYNQDQFKEYLYRSTYFESPSTTRHKYGSFIKDDSENILFDLVLQIRFT